MVGTAIVAAVGVALPGVSIAAPPPAAPAKAAAQSTDIDKAKAAAELGIVAGPELLVLTDRNFVAAMYYAADELDKPRPLEPEHQKLKEAAIAALAASGEDPSTQFIKVGIFAANKQDQAIVTERRQRQEEDRTVKSKAAAAISVPVDNTILAKTTYDFIVHLDLNADNHKDIAVKQAARTVLLGTAEAQWNFLVVGIHDEHRKDLDRLTRENTEKDEAEKAAELARQAKANAAWHALGLSSDQVQPLVNLSDQDFVIEVWNRAPHDTEVYGAAEAAVRSRNPVEWKKFIDTGAKDAHLRDIEIMLDKRDKEVIRQISELRTRAVNSLVRPDLVAAADAALAAGPMDRSDFLRVGQHEHQVQSLRIEVQNGVDYYLADSNGSVIAAPWTPGDHPEMAWKIEPGLSNPECFSFQSVTRPNNYLRWRSGRNATANSTQSIPVRREQPYVDPSDDTAVFKADATWCVRGDANSIALRPVREVEKKYLFVPGAIDDESNNVPPKLHADAPKPLLPMDRRYAAEPTLRANLGAPAGDPVLDANNLGYKPYEKGRLYLNADDFGTYKRTAVHVVYNGPILDKLLAVGGPKGMAGIMVDQAPAKDGKGQVLRFDRTGGQHHYIMWSQATGAHLVWGLIGQVWAENGAEAGPYGYPLTDETSYGDAGVRYNRFSTGTIYWVPGEGAIRQVKGEVHKKFTAMGFEAGMGYAKGDETAYGTEGGRMQRFSTGSVYITPRNGTVALNGDIHHVYAAYSYETGGLSYPISDVLSTSDGGRYVNFAANSGVIYWHATTGAHVMTAPITQKWRELGAEKSWLGYPTVDQGPLPKGLRTVFQNGRIDSSNDGGGTMAYKTTTVTPRAIEIKGVQSGRCIQVAGVGQDALNNGAGTELWDCVAGVKQIWDVVSLGDNKYNLKNRNSGKCLDLSGGSVANGISIIQNACNTSTGQQWEFTTTADTTLALRNVYTGKVAEARNSGTSNATLITQVADSGPAHQRWTLVAIN